MLIVYIGFLFVIYRITPPFFHPEIVVERNAGNMKFYYNWKTFQASGHARPASTGYLVWREQEPDITYVLRISPKYLNTNDELL